MSTIVISLLALVTLPAFAGSIDLPSRKMLNLAAIKTMAAAAEAEAGRRNVHVTICVVDESGNLLFLERGDGAALNTI